MSLYKTITVSPETKILIWKIDESYEELAQGIELTDHCQNRLDNTKSDIHQRGFLSVRHLLAQVGYVDHDLYYDDKGKPHLHDGKQISITHSFEFSAIIISNHSVGIDIEKQRDKILRIAHKFTPLEEYRTLANSEALIRKLTIVWGAKESIYKAYGSKQVSFLQHINIDDFDFDDKRTRGQVYFNKDRVSYEIFFLEFEGFTCVYAIPQEK